MKQVIFAFTAAMGLLTGYGGAAAADQSASPHTTILALGDSLVAGYGLPPGHGFTDQLEKALDGDDDQVTIINAGVSGDTSAGGLARLGWIMEPGIDLLIITLGGNDVLRALPPDQTRENLAAIITEARATVPGLTILLTGMMAPPNLGEDYADEFNTIYQDLAEEMGTALYPFFLDGVAADPALNQPDGIHPNKDGVAIIVDKIAPYVKAALAQ